MWGAAFGMKRVGEEGKQELFSHLKHLHFSISGMEQRRNKDS